MMIALKIILLKSLLNTLEYAESIQCGSLISTRYCYTEAGDFLFKSCNPNVKYPYVIHHGPLNALKFMRNGHILTGLILSSRTSLSEWYNNIDNSYFPVINFGVSLLSANCLFVDQPWFRHTVANETFWERWGSTERKGKCAYSLIS